MDDVCISGYTKEERDRCVPEVLGICWQHSLTLNHEKCVVEVAEMVFIGDVLSDQDMKLDPKKVTAIQKFPTPNNREEL